MVKSDIGSIIYSKSGTEIPVQLSSGKYVLKYIHPASGKIETINKSLKINGLYNLKVPDKKEGIIGSISYKAKNPVEDHSAGFLLFIGNFS